MFHFTNELCLSVLSLRESMQVPLSVAGKNSRWRMFFKIGCYSVCENPYKFTYQPEADLGLLQHPRWSAL